VVVVVVVVVVVGGGNLHFITQECGAPNGLPFDGLIAPVAVNAPVCVRSGYTFTTFEPSLMMAASYSAGMYPLWFSYFVHCQGTQYDVWFIDGLQGVSYEAGAAFAAPPNMAVPPRKVDTPSTGTRAAMLHAAAVGAQLLRRDPRRLPPLTGDPPTTPAPPLSPPTVHPLVIAHHSR
jgi:hypothetical protein